MITSVESPFELAAAEAERSDELVRAAVQQIAAGRPVVVTDDDDRENEGDLIFAAELATPELVGWMIRHSSGVVCVPMTGPDLDRLSIGPMVTDNADPMRTAFTVTVDAADGVTTGISAADRATTIRLLADPGATAAQFTRPGHLFPLRAKAGGVLERRGHTEAAVDLARLAGLHPAAVISELVTDSGPMLRGRALQDFAREHDLIVITIDQLADYRWRHDQLVERIAVTRLPTDYGTFTAYGYRSRLTGVEHVALVADQGPVPAAAAGPATVRVHSECLTGDAFGSLRCDCGPQLHSAMQQIARDGGVLVYLRGQEGRGIGLAPKLRAYALQELGRDTVDANLDLGLPADARSYGEAGQILRDLGVRTARLISNNPDKQFGLIKAGVTVAERIPTETFSTPYNRQYLQTKRDRMGHQLTDLPTESTTEPTEPMTEGERG